MLQTTIGSTNDMLPSTSLARGEIGRRTWNNFANCIVATPVRAGGLFDRLGQRRVDVAVDLLCLFVDGVGDVEVVGILRRPIERRETVAFLERLLAGRD